MTATNKNKPRKYIKTLHRKTGKVGARIALREFAVGRAEVGDVKAQAWCASKGLGFEARAPQ